MDDEGGEDDSPSNGKDKEKSEDNEDTRTFDCVIRPWSYWSKLSLPAPPAKKAKLKNPAVDTSFLPDREREEEERRAREQLRQEWLKTQEEMKKEEIEITCSYWDGSGHRMSVKVRHVIQILHPFLSRFHLQCKKGDDIGAFLEKCRQTVPELRGVSVDNLMYVKEDLIIPHVSSLNYTGQLTPLIEQLVHGLTICNHLNYSTTPSMILSLTRLGGSRVRCSTLTYTMMCV